MSSSILRVECEENLKKLNSQAKKKPTLKHECFDFWKAIMEFHLSERATNIELDLLIDTLLSTLRDNWRLYREFGDSDIWHNSLSIAISILNYYEKMNEFNLDFSKFNQLWEMCLSLLEESIDDANRNTRVFSAELLTILVKSLHLSEYNLRIPEVVEALKRILDQYSWPRTDLSRIYFLTSLITLIENHGLDHREVLLQNFYHLLEYFHGELKLFFLEISNRQTSSSNSNEIYRPTFHSILYEFFEKIFILAFPGCEIVATTSAINIDIVNQTLWILTEDLESNIAKALANKGNKCVISACRISLLSRLYVILELSTPNLDFSQSQSSQSKRLKSSCTIESLLEQKPSYGNFQILHGILIKWKKKLPDELLESLLQRMLILDRNLLKKDDKLDIFVQILAIFFDKAWNLKPHTLEELWNWSLSLIHTPNIHDSACDLIYSILPFVGNAMNNNKVHLFNVLVANLSRLNSFSEKTLKLINLVIRFFEFDERAEFRVEMSARMNDQREKQWRFRYQLIFSILRDSSITSDPTELIFSLLCYHPNEVLATSTHLFAKSFEELLEQWYCSNLSTKSTLVCEQDSIQSATKISFLMDKIVEIIRDLWDYFTSQSNDEKCVYLWRVLSFLRANSEVLFHSLAGLQSKFDQFVLNYMDELETNSSTLSGFDLSPFDLKKSWHLISDSMRNRFEMLAGSGLIPGLYQFIIQWNTNIPIDQMKAILNNSSSSIDSLDAAVKEIAKHELSFFDLSTLIEKFSHALSAPVLNQLIDALIIEAQEEIGSQAEESATTNFYKDKAATIVFRHIDINSLEMEKFFMLMSWTEKNIKFNQLPSRCFDLATLRRLSPDPAINPIAFCHFTRNILSNLSAGDSHAYFLAISLDIEEKLCERFIPGYYQYLNFYEKTIVYYIRKNLLLHCSSDLKRKYVRLRQNPFYSFLLEENSEVKVSYASDLFFLPSNIVEEISKRVSFQQSLLKLLKLGEEVFFTLRSKLYSLQDLSSSISVPYQAMVITSLYTIFENFNLSQLETMEDRKFLCQDITSILSSLIRDAVAKRSCSDSYLRVLVERFFILMDKWRLYIDFPQMVFLYIVDHVYARFREFPETWSFLQRNGNLNVLKYAPVLEKEDLRFCFDSMPVVFVEIFQKKELDGNLPYLKLLGFWKLFNEAIIQDPGFFTDANFCVIQDLWLYFPRLRSSLITTFIHFPAKYQENYLNFLIKNLKQKDLFVAVPEVLLFYSMEWFPASTTAALYNVIRFNRRIDSFHIQASDHAARIVPNKAYDLIEDVLDGLKIPRQVELFKPVFFNSALYATLMLARTYEFCKNEEKLTVLISDINELFKKMVVDDNTCDDDALFLLAIIALTEDLIDYAKFFDLLALTKCLIKYKMFDFASYFLKQFIDSQPFSSRVLYLFNSNQQSNFLSAIDSPMKDEIAELLIQINIGREDFDSLTMLPLDYQVDPRVRITMAKNKCDWGAVSCIDNLASTKDNIIANYYLGNKTLDCKNDVWRNLENWNELSNQVSYPKKLETHNETLYSILKLTCDGEIDEAKLRIKKSLTQSEAEVARTFLLDELSMEKCRRYLALDIAVCRESNPQIEEDIVAIWNIALLSSKRLNKNSNHVKRCVESVVSYVKQLCTFRAYQPALQLIDVCDKVSKLDHNIAIADLLIERAKILKANDERLMAIYLFKQVLDMEETTARAEQPLSELKVEAHLALADLMQNDQSYEHLKEACQLASQNQKNMKMRPAYRLKRNAIKQWHVECNNPSFGTEQRELERKKRELLCETNDLKQVENDRLRYLQEAVHNYLSALQIGNFDKTVVHRVASLFMQNKSLRFLSGLLSLLDGISPSTWLPVVNVLSSHLFDMELPIYGVVDKIISLSLIAHPYHVINSLLFYYRDSSNDPQISSDRQRTVKSLLNKCVERKDELRRIITTLVSAHSIYLDFGAKEILNPIYFRKAVQDGKSVYLLSDQLKLLQNLSTLQKVPIPIIDQP
uniref:Non-specific serine/threonine protein kinase n=1 Tax=Acrobeloides nanus TaxID=290746 RepID=A0A914EDV6_9BILA